MIITQIYAYIKVAYFIGKHLDLPTMYYVSECAEEAIWIPRQGVIFRTHFVLVRFDYLVFVLQDNSHVGDCG